MRLLVARAQVVVIQLQRRLADRRTAVRNELLRRRGGVQRLGGPAREPIVLRRLLGRLNALDRRFDRVYVDIGGAT